LLFRVAIAAVIILSIHKFLRTPEFARQLKDKAARLRRLGRLKPALYNTADLYPIGLLHSTATAIFPGLLIRIADVEQEMGHLCF
jgi:hypothetical protein